MYTPRIFRKDNTDDLHRMMHEIGAAAVVCDGPEGLIASHVPIELDPSIGQHGAIRFHFARDNDQVAAFEDGMDVLLIFQGPQSYITPSWYPSKKRTDEGVPTWNYVAIHASGTVKPLDKDEALFHHLKSMSDHFENEFEMPWSIEDAPSDYIKKLSRVIIGFEVEVTKLEGKWKMSQNRLMEDRQGVIAGLRNQGDDNSLAIAQIVEDAVDKTQPD